MEMEAMSLGAIIFLIVVLLLLAVKVGSELLFPEFWN